MKNTLQYQIGYRIKAAREAKDWTQKQLSEALGFNDRQTVSDMEQGKRTIKPEELVALSEIFDSEIDYFLDPFSIIGEAQFFWRASPKIEDKTLNAFEIKAGKWIGLLRWLRTNNQKHPSPLNFLTILNPTKTRSYEGVIECAENLAKAMQLNQIPADNLIEAIESKLDIPILFVDTIKTPEGYSVSGATCQLQDFGVILINRYEQETRCFFNIAHELFHALTWRNIKPQYHESNAHDTTTKPNRIEQLADNFAAALLMPKDSLEALIDHKKVNKISYLKTIASKFKVSPIALGWRLYNLKWIDKKIVDLMKEEHQKLNVIPKPFSKSFIDLLHDAILEGKLSARKASKAMSMNNITEFSELFSQYSLSIPFDI